MTMSMLLAPMLLVTGFGLLIAALWGNAFPTVIGQWRSRRHVRRMDHINPAEGSIPPLSVVPLATIVVTSVLASLLTTGVLIWLTDSPLVTVLLIPCWVLWTLLGVWLVEQRHQRHLDGQVVDAATRVASAMQSGVPLWQAIQRIHRDLPEPLAGLWGWLITRTGAPIVGTQGEQRYLTLNQVARALADAVPHRLLRMFLAHIEAASTMTTEDARDRLQAATDALHASRLRMAEIRAKLTHARASGLMVVGIGAGLALFLSIAMHERFVLAFQSDLAPLVGFIVGLLYLMPIAGILILSRVPAMDL